MSIHEETLYKLYPDLFRQKDNPESRSPMLYGIACGEGWAGILDELCHSLHKLFTEDGLAGDDYPMVEQVKEKFGTLRFYMSFPEAVSAKTIERAHELIGVAESKSAVTCEVCGCPGKAQPGGWIVTLCDKHSKK
jgi:hypothetical protein